MNCDPNSVGLSRNQKGNYVHARHLVVALGAELLCFQKQAQQVFRLKSFMTQTTFYMCVHQHLLQLKFPEILLRCMTHATGDTITRSPWYTDKMAIYPKGRVNMVNMKNFNFLETYAHRQDGDLFHRPRAGLHG